MGFGAAICAVGCCAGVAAAAAAATAIGIAVVIIIVVQEAVIATVVDDATATDGAAANSLLVAADCVSVRPIGHLDAAAMVGIDASGTTAHDRFELVVELQPSCNPERKMSWFLPGRIAAGVGRYAR